MKKLFLAILALSLLAIPALSQEQVGKIEGKVTTSDGAVVVGAEVTIESNALVAGSLTMNTNDRGRFRFPLLPIGTYSIRVAHQDYKKFEQTGLRVHLGGTLTLAVELQPGEFEEVITIAGEAPLIDVKDTTVGETMTNEILTKLPTPRFPTDVMGMAAGNVGGSDGGSTQGGGGYNNAYQLDGVDVSDPQLGSVWVFVNMESIEEMEIMPISGATADVGGFTGAAMNMVTRSGGNEFSGGGAYYYFDDGFLSENGDVGDYAFDGTLRESKNDDLTGYLGGPILQDKAWFFLDGGLRKRERVYGADYENPLTYEYRNALYKVTGSFTDAVSGSAMYHYDNYLRERRGWDALWEDESCSLDQEGPNKSFAVDLNWVIDDSNFIELKFHGWDGYFALLSRGRNPKTYTYDVDADWATGGAGYDYRADRTRYQFLGKYTTFLDEMYGDHTIKLGGEWTRGESVESDEWDYIEIVGGVNDYRESYFDYYYEAAAITWTGYITDSWEVNDRLLVNAGFRYEKPSFDSPDFTTPSGENITGAGEVWSGNNYAPRLGFTYKLDDEGKMLLRGSVGRYYQAMTSGMFDVFCPNVSTYDYFYWDGASWVMFDSEPLGADLTRYAIDDDVQAQYTDAVTLGIEKDLGNNIVVSADWIWRKNQNFIVQKEDGRTWIPVTGEYDGVTYNVFSYEGTSHYTYFNPDGDEFYQKYNGLILKATKRYADNWLLQASLTLSELYGNAEELSGSNTSSNYGGLSYYQDPNAQINALGLMADHRPVNFKLNALYTFPFEINASVFVNYLSGARWAQTVRVYSDDLTQGRVTIFAEERGSRTLDDIMLIDMRFEKTFRYDRYSLSLLADIYNVLNSDTVNAVDTNIYFSPDNEATSLVEGRRYQVGVRVGF